PCLTTQARRARRNTSRVPAEAGTYLPASRKLKDGSRLSPGRRLGAIASIASCSSCLRGEMTRVRREIIVANSIDVVTLRQWLGGGGEIAFLDIREEGQHGAGHPLLAVNLPYSRLELMIGQLVPRRSCPIVL